MENLSNKLKSLFKKSDSQSTGSPSKKSFNVKEILGKIKNKAPGSRDVSAEINLVPDVKNEMIRALKLRNLVFFVCIIVASASLALTLIFASIAGGQQSIVNGKKTTIVNLSAKINSYSDLSDFLTIRDQLGNISSITDNKKLLSRVFGVLSALLPTNGDSITISELSVNLAIDAPTLTFDAQANANNPPYIDYNVLDSFKKSMQYMRYDYGTYVDKEGAEIPAYCMIENGTDGATLSDPEKGIFAYWLITGDGCNPSYEETEETEEPEETDNTTDNTTDATAERIAAMTKGYETEEYENQIVVKVWRTPQYDEWYKENPKATEPAMTLDGEISNVAHFNSSCITYSGSQDETTGRVFWTQSNDSCVLVPDGIDGIVISDSSNGRGSNDSLVLRFSAVISLTPDVFSFSNKHMLALGPTGRYNVTDSYVQIQNMFGERASDCAAGDTACYNNSNIGGN